MYLINNFKLFWLLPGSYKVPEFEEGNVTQLWGIVTQFTHFKLEGSNAQNQMNTFELNFNFIRAPNSNH